LTLRYLVDTNILRDLIKNPAGKAAARVTKVGEATICTSIIVAAELRYGCAKKRSQTLSTKVEALLDRIAVVPLGVPADSEYGDIRAELEAIGQSIGLNDLLIAAHARSLGLTLVTANEREFRRVPGLQVENWLEHRA